MRHAPMTALALILGLAAAPAFAQSASPAASPGAAATGCIEAGAQPSPEAFNKLDDNGDGFVSQQEYVEKCGRVSASGRSDDAARAHFAALDADRDGKLSADDFKSAAPGQAASAEPSSETAAAAPPAGRAEVQPPTLGGTAGQADRAPLGGSPVQGESPANAGAAALTALEADRVIGMDVVNTQGEDLGEIKDLVIDRSQVAHAVISVGGFLGIGARDVAVPFEQLSVGQDNVTLMSESSKDELKQMPAYKERDYTRVDWKNGRAPQPRQ